MYKQKLLLNGKISVFYSEKSLNSFKNKRVERTASWLNSDCSNNSAARDCCLQTWPKQWRKKTRSASFRFTSAKAIKTIVGVTTETTTLATLSKWIKIYEIAIVVVVATLADVGGAATFHFHCSMNDQINGRSLGADVGGRVTQTVDFVCAVRCGAQSHRKLFVCGYVSACCYFCWYVTLVNYN